MFCISRQLKIQCLINSCENNFVQGCICCEINQYYWFYVLFAGEGQCLFLFDKVATKLYPQLKVMLCLGGQYQFPLSMTQVRKLPLWKFFWIQFRHIFWYLESYFCYIIQSFLQILCKKITVSSSFEVH